MDETIDFLLRYSTHVDVDIRSRLGGARLDQMLCHRICTYGRYFDINRRMFPSTIEADFAKCKESDKMVQVALDCFYKKKGRWYRAPDTVEKFTVLVWADTLKEALAKAETFYHQYGTEEIGKPRFDREKDAPYLLVNIPGVDDDNWSNKGS